MERRIPPREIQPSLPVSLKNLIMKYGENACTILGFQCTILYSPMQKIDSNQIITTGANIKATLWVPKCCRANSPTNMTQASKRTSPTENKEHEYYQKTHALNNL